MQPSRQRQRPRPRPKKVISGVDKQRRFFSVVLVFCSLSFVYLSYKQVVSWRQPALLKTASEATRNLVANQKNVAISDYSLKPLPFCKIDSNELVLYFPARIDEVLGVGFHESEKIEALNMQPMGDYHMRESTETVGRVVSMSRFPVLFVMYSRGRKQTPTSAVDVAVKSNATIRSPVDGVITKVETYYLYGKYIDYRIEIKPNDHQELRVVMIHLDKPCVSVGQKVYRGNSKIAIVRQLSHNFDSQINEYIPKECDHTHIQVNRYIPEKDNKTPINKDQKQKNN